MSNYDFMMTTTYNEIKNQIVQLWMDYDKDGVMEDIIEEFKYFYGNHDNSLCYYDFEIESVNETLLAQKYIMQHMDDNGYDMVISDMLQLASPSGIKKHLIYWIMEEIDFAEIIVNL